MGAGTAALAGFGLSLGLILAIGPQNVFVIRQGLMRSHVFAVCLTCALCDALFILLGVLGAGAYFSSVASLERILVYGAALFIAGYGLLRLRAACRPQAMVVDQLEEQPLRPTLVAALGFTFLNPHVYLDTLLLLGGASTRFIGSDKVAFASGAILASFVFFFALGYAAKRLAEVFTRPSAWQRIDAFIGVTMLCIAVFVVWPFL